MLVYNLKHVYTYRIQDIYTTDKSLSVYLQKVKILELPYN